MFGSCFSEYAEPFNWPETWQSLLISGMDLITMAKKKCPPPRSWDGIKKLPWPIVIYYDGRVFYDVLGYDLDKGYFDPTDGEGRFEPGKDNFLVQRLH